MVAFEGLTSQILPQSSILPAAHKKKIGPNFPQTSQFIIFRETTWPNKLRHAYYHNFRLQVPKYEEFLNFRK